MAGRDPRSRLGLDYVSPLPPVRSGIADYSADLLPHLAERCDLRVVRLPGQPVEAELVERYHPVEAGAAALGDGGRVPLYQMGNNAYHEQVLRLATVAPGLLTLHDVFLHHLLLELSLGRGEIEPYIEQLRWDHGWMGEAAAMPPRWGAYAESALFALPSHRRLLQSQRGVLVHSGWAENLLREEMPDLAVRVIPMPMPLGEVPDPQAAASFRQSLAIPPQAPVLGSFGFQTPIKRTDTVIRSLALDSMRSVHLLVVGAIAESLDLPAIAAQAGVTDRVHFLGYVSRRELSLAMAAADLCVNLRYPTAGETSASLLRLFAQGRASVVSDYAQFCDLPDTAVVKIPLGEGETKALADRVGELLREPGRLAAMGRAARDLVGREHDPAAAADRLVEACTELAQRQPGTSRPAAPPPPTTLTWGRIEGDLEIEGIEPVWAPGSRRRLTIRLRNRGLAVWLAGHRGAGGVSVEIRLDSEHGDELAGRPWPGLAQDVAGGEEIAITLDLRRPPGPCRLVVEPHVLGYTSFSTLGGPRFEKEI